MKNRNGFTLIELLAVILILGVIALIAMPAVTTVVKQAKRGAFDSTVKNIVKEVQSECTLRQISGGKAEAVYFFTHKGVSPTLDVTGKIPTSGFIKTDSNCNVKVSINDGDFVAVKKFDEDTVSLSEGIPKPYGDNIVEYYEFCINIPDTVINSDNPQFDGHPEVIPAIEVMERRMCYRYDVGEDKVEYMGVNLFFDTTDESIVEAFGNLMTTTLVNSIGDPNETSFEKTIVHDGDKLMFSIVSPYKGNGDNYSIEDIKIMLAAAKEAEGLELTRYISYK